MKKLFIVALLASTAAAGYYFYSAGLRGEDATSTVETLPIADSETIESQSNQSDIVASDLIEVDESALRYFAMKGDKTRLNTEIARLKALYPNWSPPENPLAIAQTRDTKLDQLWKFYTDGQYAELRKAIAARKIQEPQWVVPADLIAKLELAEARQRLINASDNEQYEMVVNLASQTPQLLTCSEIDILWRLAESFVKLDKSNRARDGYIYILKNCTTSADRLVTVQKALENLSYDEVQQVLAQQKFSTDGQGEFASLNDDIARRFVALAAKNPDMMLDKSYLTTLETLAKDNGLASDAEMLGWYYLRRNEMNTAEKWFLLAKEKDDSVTVSQGLALVLNSKDDFAQAENIMYPWRDQSSEASDVYFATTANLLATDPPIRMPANISQEVMSRIATAVVEAKNVSTAEQLGWYARAIGQNPTAIQWFQAALLWDNSNEPSAYGLAVSYYTMGNKAELEQVKRAWGAYSQRIVDVGTERDKYSRTATQYTTLPYAPAGIQQAEVRQQIPQVYQAPQRAEPRPVTRQQTSAARTQTKVNPRNCRRTLETAAPTGGNAVAHGWCLMEMNRPLEAVKSFESALNTGSAQVRSDAAYGQSLAYLRAGLVDKASVSAIKAPMSKARQKELRVAILSDRAVAAYQGGQFRDTLFILEERSQLAAPRKDLMALQAASYLKLRRYDDARIIYEALAASGDREGIRGMAAIRDLQRR